MILKVRFELAFEPGQGRYRSLGGSEMVAAKARCPRGSRSIPSMESTSQFATRNRWCPREALRRHRHTLSLFLHQA